MATANAILLRQRLEKSEQETQKQMQSEKDKILRRKKTEKLARKANLRYEEVISAVELAENRIGERLKENRTFSFERKGQGVASLLSSGNYIEPSKAEK